MDYSLYVAKTLTVAITKIGPAVVFLVMGYFVFLKLPFLIFRNSLRANKGFEVDPMRMKKDEGFNFQDYENFMKKQARAESGRTEKAEERKEEPKQKRQEERRQKERPEAPPRQEKSNASPEEILFHFESGQRFTKDQLKKRYRELLKQNHPDMVATEGTQIRKQADIKSKEINSAYEKLKGKAA